MTLPASQIQAADAGGSFFGGLLVLFGTAALLMHYGILPAIALWKLWPLVFVWLGLLRTTEPGRRLSGLFWVLLGGTVQAYYFGLLHSPLEWKLLWPLGVIALGLRIWGAGRRPISDWHERHMHYHGGFDHHAWHEKRRAKMAGMAGDDFGEAERDAAPPSSEPGEPSASDREPMVVELLMAGRQDHRDGRWFAGGRVRCLAAGYELDLRGAHMLGDEIVLEVDVTMGGIDLRVPRGWRVEVEASPILGGIDNRTQCANPERAPRLLVRGRILMGGVDIRN